ncbi:MAG: hypothetical protein V1921_07070 [Candidatus Altiarchaeota archaeon]
MNLSLNENNRVCRFRSGDRCSNEMVAHGPIVNDSLQSQWYCSACKYFEKG